MHINSAQKAIDLVYGDRPEKYGHPADVYQIVARLWSGLLDIEITPKQAALMMALMKIAREMNKPHPYDDNIVDAHGYLLVYERIDRRERGLE